MNDEIHNNIEETEKLLNSINSIGLIKYKINYGTTYIVKERKYFK